MWYDLLTLAILMYAMFRGAMKGIVWQLATIAALVLCFFFSGSLSAAVAPFIRVEPPLNRWIAMFVLYLGFSFVSFGVARVLHEMIESMRIEALDRHLGAILGLVKGGMFSLFLTFFLVTLSHSARETIITSESGYVAAVVMDRLDPVLPGGLHALLDPYIRRLDGPAIEREHREERLARDGSRDDDRDPLDRRELTDDRDDVDRDRPDGSDRGRSDRDRLDRDRLQRDGLDRDGDGRVGIDQRVDPDRANPDRPRRLLTDDRKGLDDRRPVDDDRDGLSRSDRDRRRSSDVGKDGVPDRNAAPGRDGLPDRDGLPNRDGIARRDDVDRGPRRNGDDPFSAADADRPVRRRERRRSDDRPELRPASDLADDSTRPTNDENDWLSSLPSLTDELKQLALRAWRKTRPEHRRDLTRRLTGSSVPDLIRKTLEDWIASRPAPVGDAGDERADLERDISRALTDSEADRSSAVDDIEASLKGIPGEIAVKVLRDWRADLLDKNSDPDPRTTDRSSLNDRILSQLSKSGVSLRSLDAATRERLRGSETR